MNNWLLNNLIIVDSELPEDLDRFYSNTGILASNKHKNTDFLKKIEKAIFHLKGFTIVLYYIF